MDEILAPLLGGGLMAAALAVGAYLLGGTAWFVGFFGPFVAVVFLIVVGGRKYAPDAPRPGEHRVLRALLPQRAFAAVRAGTKEWLIECRCGHKRDLWEAGGVRYKAAGEPRQYLPCPACEEGTWHRTRRKTDSERAQVA
jgi:hypothetical protein